MENASKALIIAGGVLLGVALISLALYLFASARGLVDASDRIIEQSQIESFNRFYYSYAPSLNTTYEISGLDAYNIIRKVENDNKSEVIYSEIALQAKGVYEEVKNPENYFKKGYKITLSDRNGDTAIDTISITK